MKCAELLGRESFTLADIYGFEARLGGLYPGNRNVRREGTPAAAGAAGSRLARVHGARAVSGADLSAPHP